MHPTPSPSTLPARFPAVAALAAVAVLGAACTSETYTIPDRELARLAKLPPKARGERVRVVQDLAWDVAPEGPDPCVGHDHGHFYIRSTRAYGPRRAYPRVHPHHGGGGGGGGIDVGGGGGGGGSGGGGGGSLDLDGGKELAWILLLAGAVITVGLIATEGSRYDGYVEVSEHHPIHLFRRDGSSEVVHLSELTRDDLRSLDRAVLVPYQADGASFLGRAPLDRRGFAWSFELGQLEFTLPDGTTAPQWAGTMGLGYFPKQEFGLLGTLTLSGGTHKGGDTLSARYGLEARLVPLAVGPLHLGGFGWGGWSYDASEGGALDTQETLRLTVGGGGLAEVEITTRLSLLLRGGVYWQRDRFGDLADPAFLFTGGVEVY